MESRYFLPYQRRWIDDPSPLRIVEKSRQIGLTTADAYDSVIKAIASDRALDVWVSSRDLRTAREYLRICKHWAETLEVAASGPEWEVFDKARDLGAFTLRFKSGRCIFSVSSSPDALVGKTGHIKLDEFAIHRDQRELYRIAKPCTTWGGQLSIISTHRGDQTVFYEILDAIKHHGNPMGWSHHRVTLQDAVDAGLVEKINKVRGLENPPADLSLAPRSSDVPALQNVLVTPGFSQVSIDQDARKTVSTVYGETREQFVRRLRSECLDEEQWLQEYCCVPADDHSAFITHQMITDCEQEGCLQTIEQLEEAANPLYAGVDVARKEDLCVIDVGEKIGDVIWDRLRIELRGATFAEIEDEFYRIMELPMMRRACVDATGLGMQLAERAQKRFRHRIEPVHFTADIKEQFAYGLRLAFEEHRLRLDPNPNLRADLRSIRKEVTSAGNLRFGGEAKDSHCDRFWAKALRQHATSHVPKLGAMVV
ncbi:MAG TPA: hypothetical protein VJ063_09355 [Verrucomicrobiae bacterium]|nr:hypothetical protein [Verrucomicrobiae bacterium]